jgi:hypothetical protein
MLALVLSVFLGFFQTSQTGTVVGSIKLPNGSKPATVAHVMLLSPKYTEVWNKQVQQRLDNYWEIFKPELAVHKEHITDIYRMVHSEAFGYVASTMRRELGEAAASKFIKDASPAGQFEFRGVPFATYQVLAQTTTNGENTVWSTTVDVDTDVPLFVDLGKPVT